MPQFINTNIMAVNSQRNLNRSQSGLSTALQRLSSGLRINSAKDDAAGLAISERFSTQIRGLSQAVRNSNDGVSLSQVAEGALDEVSNMLQRIRELAVQSVNATNSPTDRLALQAEVGQLTSELARVAKTTTFNGQKILDGSFGTALFQVGSGANEFIPATTGNFKTDQYGDYRITGYGSSAAAGTRYGTVANNTIVVSGAVGTKTITWASTTTAGQVADKVNLFAAQTGVSASAITETDLVFAASGSYKMSIQSDNTQAVTVGFAITAATGVEALSAAATAFNDVQAKTGVVAQVKSDGSGIRLTHYTGGDVVVLDTGFSNAGDVTVSGTSPAAAITLNADTTVETAWVTGQVIFDSDKSFTVQGTAAIVVSLAQEASALQKVQDIDVSTVTGATLTLSIADAALAQVSSQRAKYGALQSRFDSTIRNLETAVENLSAARSRIKDADFAMETSSLTRAQILQQAGTAMLAQANQVPQGVLRLLQ